MGEENPMAKLILFNPKASKLFISTTQWSEQSLFKTSYKETTKQIKI
jgi:hypothetical protein